jgi:hypothetical protein
MIGRRKYIGIILIIIVSCFYSCGNNDNNIFEDVEPIDESKLMENIVEIMDDPIPICEIIKPYLNDSLPESILDVDQFNKNHKDQIRIMLINNTKDSLVFFFSLRYTGQLIYYNRGMQIKYSPISKKRITDYP